MVTSKRKLSITIGIAVVFGLITFGIHHLVSNSLNQQLDSITNITDKVGWKEYIESIQSETQNIDEYFVEDILLEIEDTLGDSAADSKHAKLSSNSGLVKIGLDEHLANIIINRQEGNQLQNLEDIRFVIQQYCDLLILVSTYSSGEWSKAKTMGQEVNRWLQEEPDFNCPTVIKQLPTEFDDSQTMPLQLAIALKDENA